MVEEIFSPSWYRVASLQPRLRNHAEIHRHLYRGELWYVLQDGLSGRQHRFTPAAHHLIALMDGSRTMQQIWELATAHLGDDAPTQGEILKWLGDLHAGDLLLCDVPANTAELLRRQQRHAQQKSRMRWLNPLSVRVPLWDPQRFLKRFDLLNRCIFSGAGALVWMVVVAAALYVVGTHWAELSHDVSDTVLAPGNLLLLLLVYPIVKLLHELGHAFAVRRWGGEVHELGVMLLVFVPVPYVDASAANAFGGRHRRILVSAAGILTELFIAALASFVWLLVEPGTVRAVAFNLMLIAGVSTLLFNANPLLRFDGYFIFADWVEIPNLAGRATQYLSYLLQRHAFGLRGLESPAQGFGERFWLVAYGLASFVYRVLLTGFIVLFVAEKYFVFGVVLAMWALLTMVVLPLGKAIRQLLTGAEIAPKRVRAVAVVAGGATALLGALAFLPVPLDSRAEGVVWLPERAVVRASAAGFVRRVLKADASQVAAGDVLLETEDPLLSAQADVLAFKVQDLQARYTAQRVADVAKANMMKQAVQAAQLALDRARQEVDSQRIASPAAGLLRLPHAQDLRDQWVRRGDVIGYVMQPPLRDIRAVVAQDSIGLVRERTRSVEVRPVDAPDRVYHAVIEREVPAASDELPSAALGRAGGGEVPIRPGDTSGTHAFETVFQFDLQLVGDSALERVGTRVWVRFDHGAEPLLTQGFRKLRLLLLRRYGV